MSTTFQLSVFNCLKWVFTIDPGPQFCTPFPAHKFDYLFEKAEKPEWNEPALDFNGNSWLFFQVCSEGGPIVMSDVDSHPDATLKKETGVVGICLLVVELNSHPS